MFGKISNAVGRGQAADKGSTALRLASIPAVIVLAAGGYALAKLKGQRDREAAKRASFETPPGA